MKRLALLMITLCLSLVIIPASLAQDSVECADEEIAVDHALGTTCVPENVEDVVALEWTYVEDLLALRVLPPNG